MFYYITIGSVLAVLALSANTGFADFPRLCRVIAQDGFLPNAFAHRGRRLVYSHGILVLAVLSAALLVVFGGITDSLIPLFAVGAFLAFTLSQAGMVEHWRRLGGPGVGPVDGDQRPGGDLHGGDPGRGPGLQVRRRGLGDGPADPGPPAPVRRACRPTTAPSPARCAAMPRSTPRHLEPPIALLPIRGWSAITRKALRMALKISPDVYALHIAGDEHAVLDLEDTWQQRVRQPAMAAGVEAPRLIVIFSPFRQLYGPLMQVVTDLQRPTPAATSP